MSDANAEYRRGSVFGLTVAEIFILLLFLLLILLALFEQDADRIRAEQRAELVEAKEKLKNTEEELEDTEEELAGVAPWRPVIQRYKTPNTVETLVRAGENAQQEARQLEEDVKKLRGRVAEAERDAEVARDAAQQHKSQAEALRGVAGGQTVAEAIEAATEGLIAERKQAEQRADEAAREVEEARQELNLLLTKGHNPPCWYRLVPDGEGGERERPEYIFNIGVFADHFILRRASTPIGGATDDGDGTYAEEAEFLELDGLIYNQPLGDAELRKLLQPIHDKGKKPAVRSYPCIFWVRLWDLMPEDAKERWQHAVDLLEELFGTYRVRDEPWQP